jgi:DNA-binding transcriptional LysR family regulator
MGVMLQMLKQGLGIAQMPCALCEPDPDLYRIPATYIEPGWGLWILSHVDLRTTARVRVFKNFLLEELKKQKALLEGS